MRYSCASPNTERTTRLIALRARQVVAERLLEDDADVRPVQAGRAELGADDREQVRAGGEEHDDDVGRRSAADRRREPVLEPRVVARLREIEAQVVEQGGEAIELVVARALGVFDFGEAVLDPGAVGVVGEVLARDGEDAAAFGQLAVTPGLEQRRHQLSPGQVAGAAEENEVERHAARIRCRADPSGRTRPRDDGGSAAASAVTSGGRDGRSCG